MTGHLISLSLLTSLAACGGSAPAGRANQKPPAPPAAHARAVADLVGVWAGQATRTPLGAFPMALAFDRTADGSVHTRLDGADGMYLDFRFHRDGQTWLLTEEGFLPGLGVQKHVLVPVQGGPGARWVDREDAAALAVDIDVDGRTLLFSTRLRGKDHARFELGRMEGEAADKVRARIAASAPKRDGAVSSPR